MGYVDVDGLAPNRRQEWQTCSHDHRRYIAYARGGPLERCQPRANSEAGVGTEEENVRADGS